uniref:Uncharacterized protein n=1 Tax=Photinus pyralis TaxID=7054 RepID=A0A1Y1KT89_PHOPY
MCIPPPPPLLSLCICCLTLRLIRIGPGCDNQEGPQVVKPRWWSVGKYKTIYSYISYRSDLFFGTYCKWTPWLGNYYITLSQYIVLDGECVPLLLEKAATVTGS